MSDLDEDISNGTCYWAPGERANPRMLPCGNAGLGHKTCCEAGDACLKYGACHMPGGRGVVGLAYLAGCSDPEYEDESCPDKAVFRGTASHYPVPPKTESPVPLVKEIKSR
ncbi:hypothetical protein IMZ48_43550 [Candidatus Bathyarchaeota archaeon]|nr:hypothetical protein [Candidatus Bathyarchaeota archaeon]